jgi:hypothetical protein
LAQVIVYRCVLQKDSAVEIIYWPENEQESSKVPPAKVRTVPREQTCS